MLLCSFFGPSGCAAERLNLSALRRLRLRGTERQLPLMGFKDHPKCFGTKPYFGLEGPGLQCLHCRPSSSRSHASRSTAPVVLTTTAASPSSRLSDVAIAHLDLGLHVVLPSPAFRQLQTLRHTVALRSVPLTASGLPPHTTCCFHSAWLHGWWLPSRRWLTSAASPHCCVAWV